MKFFFSGGTLPTVPEDMLPDANVMNSYANDFKNGVPNTRIRRLMRMKRKERKNGRKGPRDP